VGKRRLAREMAVQMLYQNEMGGAAPEQVMRHFDLAEHFAELPGPAAEKRRLAHEAFEYAQRILLGVVKHSDEIDGLIRGQADNWRMERMPPVDRNILRMAVYELLHEPETPQLVVVDEAIEIAKKFGSEHSGRFVNGLLDGILKTHKLMPTGGATR
jgi:N utilization substance protein B